MSRRRGRRGCLALGLLLLEKLDDEVLVLADEVVGEASRGEVVAKVFPPLGIESFERRKLGPRWLVAVLPIGAARAGVATGMPW
jgi:hypothetical protein